MNWYEEHGQGLGGELLEVVERALDEIREAPERWPLWKANRSYRRRVLRRFPYSIFYVVDPDVIIIVALAHHKRRPGYWLP